MTPATSRRRQEPATPALAAAAILAAGLWAYHNSFFAPFIFDDIHVILDNPHILRLWPLTYAMDGPAGSSVVARPVVALSLAVNYALGGFAVWGYHAVSVALHAASALTLYGIVRRTLLSARLRRAYGTAAQPLALFTALLWLVHPLLTEAVTYVIQRTELFMGLFYLLTLYCAIRAGDARRDRGRWRAAAVACCLLGMASKEVMVTAPVLVVLYDWTFSGLRWPALWRERGRFYMALAATWALSAFLVLTHPRPLIGFHLTGMGLGPVENAMTQLGVLAHYLRLAVWPSPLILDYQDWPVTRSLVDIGADGLGIALLIIGTGWGLARRHPLGFLGAWYFLIIAPASLVPMPTEIAAERRMYLSLISVVAIAVIGGWTWVKRLIRSPGTRRLLAALLAAQAVALFGIMTILRNDDYRSGIRIWQDTAAKRPANDRAWHNLGVVLAQAGKAEPAVCAFEKAQQLEPARADTASCLCLLLNAAGRAEEGMRQCERSLALDPSDARAHHNLGIVHARAGRRDEAIPAFQEAIRLRPGLVAAHSNLGTVLAEDGRLDEALAHLRRAKELDPNLPDIDQRIRYVEERQ